MDITYSVMIPLLQAFAQACHSYGWAILLLTGLIRLIVWPLVASSTKSMQRMSQLQPKMKLIQERYKDNPELLQKKVMEFYQKNKVNPLGGCIPTLVQLPVLFALFATFTGPPFQDKPIPVKVQLVKPADASKVKVVSNPTSGANSPYVSKDGKLAKLVVQPGDQVLIFGQDAQGQPSSEPKTIDFHVIPQDGSLPADFKPKWKIGSDTNAATMAPGSGEAQFTTAGDVTIEAVLPKPAKPIDVVIHVDPKEGDGPGFLGFLSPQDAFKTKTEQSSETSTVIVDGKQYNLAVTPGPSTVIAGRKAQFHLKSLDNSPLPPDLAVTWRISKDPAAATIDDDGKATFPRPSEVVVDCVVPGEAAKEPFLFISSIGKVAKGMELLEPKNWDVLGMILAFAATMWVSSKLMSPASSANMDPDQAAIQKQTQQTMPIALTAMFFFIPLPAGVYLYMVASNVFQSLQTWLITRHPAPGLVDVDDDEPGGGGSDNKGGPDKKPGADKKSTGFSKKSGGEKKGSDKKSEDKKSEDRAPQDDDQDENGQLAIENSETGETIQNSIKLTGDKEKSKKKK